MPSRSRYPETRKPWRLDLKGLGQIEGREIWKSYKLSPGHQGARWHEKRNSATRCPAKRQSEGSNRLRVIGQYPSSSSTNSQEKKDPIRVVVCFVGLPGEYGVEIAFR